MGCASTRDQVYEVKQPQFSNRDMNQTNYGLQVAVHHATSVACGYEFGINVQNLDPSSSPNKQKAKQKAELERFDRFMEIYKDMQDMVSASRIDQAYQLHQQLKILHEELDFDLVPQIKKDKKEEMLQSAELVQWKYQQLKDFQKQLFEQQWKETFVQDSMTVKYRREKSVCVVLAESEVDVCLELMVATFGSIARYHQFMKFALISKQNKKVNIFHRLGEISYDIPFCTKSTGFVEEAVFDRIQFDGSVIIGYQSLFQNKKIQKRLNCYPVFEHEPKIDYSKIICKMEPIEANKTKVSLLFKIRGHIQPIADWVTDKLYKNIGIASLKKLVQKARTFGQETDTQIFEGDDELYHHFHRLIKDSKEKLME